MMNKHIFFAILFCMCIDHCMSKEPCATAPPYFTNNSGSGCGNKIRKRRRRKNGGGGRVVPTLEPTTLFSPTVSPTEYPTEGPTEAPTTYITLPIVPTGSPTGSPSVSPTVGIEPAPSMGTKLMAALLVLVFTLILGVVG